ncbi:hypothetical protein EXIGLDRAFT_832008 [Exidia glandulosa HHB12029]|uniref:Methyltransferase domain-containing protein n=1 Tax=Exidia glandulosa HHB12029 TaxID=1314781 RepID=A0A165M5I7_EXIGL|nr:hypothetical protein EXIGLDRAFT_832008 [Exidia glandulosa HHB12029]
MTIDLPARYSEQAPDSRLASYARDLLAFLSSPNVVSIFHHHPNWVVANGHHTTWDDWWDWAGERPRQWERVVDNCNVPGKLGALLQEAQSLSLPRESGERPMDPLLDGNGHLPVGMSPKKAHEVRRMSAFVASAVKESRAETRHIVDVGAGQGYLSRALSSPPHSFDVLALDSSDVQTHGARMQETKIARRRAKRKKHGQDDVEETPAIFGSLEHKLVKVNSESLDAAISEWVPPRSNVHLVALHACGGLTPTIMRQYVAQTSVEASTWRPSGMTAVGCCYHLMELPRDFPLSVTVQTLNAEFNFELTLQHLHLAAQCPAHWKSSPEAWENTELAVKKIVYRALLVRLLPDEFQPHRDGMPSAPRLGRLNDSAYDAWSHFLAVAAPRMGFDPSGLPQSIDDAGELALLARRVEVLHILRCVLGPVVESLILLDRYLFLQEKLPEMRVDLVNLFDQASGSARNVALAVW